MSKIVKVGTLGLVDDAFGEQAAADAARSAGRLQADAAGRAETGINRRFDITQKSLQPAIDTGNLARDQQSALLGLSGAGAQETAIQNIAESPAQQFLRKRAQKNLLQNAAAIGGVGGGDVRSALVEQGVGFAQQDTENQFNRLNQLSAPGTQTAVNVGQLGANAANQAGNAIMQGGQALASGELGAAQARANATNQFLQLGALGVGAFTGGAGGAAVGGGSQFLTPQSSNVNIGFL